MQKLLLSLLLIAGFSLGNAYAQSGLLNADAFEKMLNTDKTAQLERLHLRRQAGVAVCQHRYRYTQQCCQKDGHAHQEHMLRGKPCQVGRDQFRPEAALPRVRNSGRGASPCGCLRHTRERVPGSHANGPPLDSRSDNGARAAVRGGSPPVMFGYTDQGADPREITDPADPRLSHWEGVLPGFEDVMPKDLAKKLTGEELDAVVAYVLSLE